MVPDQHHARAQEAAEGHQQHDQQQGVQRGEWRVMSDSTEWAADNRPKIVTSLEIVREDTAESSDKNKNTVDSSLLQICCKLWCNQFLQQVTIVRQFSGNLLNVAATFSV